MSGYDKAMVEHSRQLVMRRLSMPRVPTGCKHCDYVMRCASLAPGRAVMCELSDDDAQVSPDEANFNTYNHVLQDDPEYYLQVHLLLVPSRSGAE